MIKTKEEVESEPLLEDRLLLPSEVAKLFHVCPKSVSRWAKTGKISCIRTLGGHRRFYESEILKALADLEEHATPIEKPTKEI